MSIKKYEKVWELMTRYNFDFDLNIYKEFKCILCKLISKNTYQSSCGCRYCYECIQKYLNLNNTSCPGNNEDCKSQVIYLQVDHTANLQISRISVRCPLEHCTVKCELNQMTEHIKSHEICPFSKMGCCQTIQMDFLADHLKNEYHSHMNLLSSAILRIQSQMINCEKSAAEISKMTELVDHLKKSNQELIDENQHLKTELKSIDGKSKEIENTLNENVKTITNSYLKEVFDRIFNLESSKVAWELKQMDLLEKSTLESLKSSKKLELDFQKWRQEFLATKKEIIMMKSMFELKNMLTQTPESKTNEDTERKILRGKRSTPLQIQGTKTEVSVNGFSMASEQLTNNLESLKLRISNFTDIYVKAKAGVEMKILGQPFYTANQYRFCLSLYPNGVEEVVDEYLSVAIQVIKGEFDDQLTWPVEHTVIFGLVDQTDDLAVFTKPSVEINCTFNKPTSEISKPIGPRRFIKLKTLFGNPNFIKNDSIVLALSLKKS